jgi:hypothetical protein
VDDVAKHAKPAVATPNRTPIRPRVIAQKEKNN